MKGEVESDQSAGRDADYQAAARAAWHAGATAALRLTVTSDSMRPLLRAGDAVAVQPIDPHALQPGEVIVVQRGGEWITHRLVAVDARGWHTHGDNTRYTDAVVSADHIVGRVIAIERGDHTIDLRQPRWRAIDRRINRVQRLQLQVLGTVRAWGGTRSGRLQRGLAAFINWPFQMMVHVLIRF
jgi:signal peptidase I